MSKQPIPNDWDNLSYSYLSFLVPDSTMWRGIVKGLIYGLSKQFAWDPDTGSIDSAALVALDIFDSCLRDKIMTPLLSVTLPGVKSIPGNAGNDPAAFTRVEYDPGSDWNNSTYVYTVPEDGFYILGASIEIVDMSTPSWARIRVQETSESPANMLASSGTVVQTSTSPHITAKFEGPAYLLQGNTLRWFVSHNDTVNRNTSSFFKLNRAWVIKI